MGERQRPYMRAVCWTRHQGRGTRPLQPPQSTRSSVSITGTGTIHTSRLAGDSRGSTVNHVLKPHHRHATPIHQQPIRTSRPLM